MQGHCCCMVMQHLEQMECYLSKLFLSSNVILKLLHFASEFGLLWMGHYLSGPGEGVLTLQGSGTGIPTSVLFTVLRNG